MPAIVLHSGGQDSTTCLAWAIEEFGREGLLTVSFDYGQRHKVELKQARTICEKLGVPEPYVIKVPALDEFGAAALTNPDIEVEAEASEDSANAFAHSHGLPSTFVPGRNMIFLGLAAAFGAQRGIYDLVTGVCEADAAGYPDCRQKFIGSMEDTISFALDEPSVAIHAPLLALTKADTWALASNLGILDLVINETHTCYNGDRSHYHEWGWGCGLCPACNERARGYEEFVAKVGA